MKNTVKFLGIIALAAVIGFSMAACGDDGSDGGDGIKIGSTSGRLTITGLGDYNGKFVRADDDGDDDLIACENLSITNVTNGTISNGSVTLKVWKFSETGVGNFNGSGQITFWVSIFSKKTMTDDDGDDVFVTGGQVTATFTNGVGSGVFEEY